jgi:hypothetical protein
MQRLLFKKEFWITTGALLFEIKGPAYCIKEKGLACWVEETVIIVMPFFWLRGLFLVIYSIYSLIYL